MMHAPVTYTAGVLLIFGMLTGSSARGAPADDVPSLVGTDMEPLLSVATGAYDLPEVRCLRASGKIVIDGKLAEKDWPRAARLDFVDVVSAGPSLCGASDGFLLWDDACLYVAVRARDRNVWATMARRDDTLCHEEVIEVFIDPDGEQKRYVEIEVNPRNAVFDLRYAPDASGAIQEDKAWNCPGLRHAVAVDGTLNRPDDDDREWVVEMAIPWKAFEGIAEKSRLPPKEGDVWRLNLYRYERPNGPASPDRPVEHTAWSPTRRVNFHVPACFGKVAFAALDDSAPSSGTVGERGAR